MTDTIYCETVQKSTDNLYHALHYAEKLGWVVFPAPAGKKKSHKSAKYSGGRRWGATKDPDEIRGGFEQWPDANVGVVCGEISTIFVVEADTLAGHDVDGIASIAALESEHGPLPATAQAESPSGSIHYYFRHPGFRIKNSASEIAAGVDVRGDGGMVIAPPSMKPGVGAYTWRNRLPVADAPQWLLDLVKAKTAECSTITGAVPDAIGGVSHDGIRYEELCWWISGKVDRWTDGTESLGNDEWVSLGKRIKLSFPGEDGLAAFLAMSWADQHEAIARRWSNPNDFKTEGENLQTLPALLKNDTTWMFRHLFGCPQQPAPSQPWPADWPPCPMPSNWMDGAPPLQPMHDMPLAGHPNLTAPQADALVKFWAHLPSGKMIYEGTREMWASGSLDKHIGRIKDAMATGPGTLASTWLSQHRAVESMGWSPGEPMIIEGKVLTIDGWLQSPGDKTFNRYVPPDIEHIEGDVSKWLNHIKFIYPSEADHIVNWLAHRVQRPGDKVNHCLDFIGNQGIGKDTILAPVIAAIGSQNFKQITAKVFYNSEWNDYLQSVIMRINEVHDLGGESRYGFYDATKDVITNPPEMHRINIKHLPQYAAANVCGVVMTSNHLDALYISPDDRRHYVCVSTRTKEEFPPGYFDEMHAWFENGGNEAVAHYLANLDGAFNAKSPPPHTEGWHMVVAAGLAPESGDLSDVIEALGKPAAVTLHMIRARTPIDSQLRLTFEDAKLRRAIPKRLAEAGYIAVANPDARDSGGRWRMSTGRMTIYARQELSENERLAAAKVLATASLPCVPT